MSALIASAIQQLANSKEMKKYTVIKDELLGLQAKTQHLVLFQTSTLNISVSLKAIEKDLPEKILSLIDKLIKTRNSALQTNALDLLSKIMSYNYFSETYMEAVVDLINQSFTGENTDDRVLIQIFKALQTAVTTASIHDAALLTVVRTAYNIFVLSKKGAYQSVAQSILSQMILFIFGRIKVPPEYRGDISSYQEPVVPKTVRKGFASSVEVANELLDEIVDKASSIALGEKSDFELHLRDAYLVFRALCRLSLKPLPEITPSKRDTHFIALRSKILSLEMLSVIIREHFPVVSCTFPIHGIVQNNPIDEQHTDDKMEGEMLEKDSDGVTTFVQGVKNYLCVSLSRNAVSLVPEVLDRSLDIFIRLVFGMRHSLKKEIEVFFSEIFLATLESKSNLAITYHQKLSLLKAISTLLSSPDTLIEIYLNYDCDPEALDNVFERIVAIMSKLLTSRDLKVLQTAPPLPPGEIGLDVGGFGISNSSAAIASSLAANSPSPNVSSRVNPSKLSPSASSSTLKSVSSSNTNGLNNDAKSPLSPAKPHYTNSLVPEMIAPAAITLGLHQNQPEKDQSLKWRALECIATLMQSMVVWHYVKSSENSMDEETSPGGEEENTPHLGAQRSSISVGTSGNSPVNNDLNRFESAKNLKLTIREGVQLFNWKSKKGLQYLLDHGVITNTPESISKFLLTTAGLSKKEIGEYLGEGDPFNITVMHCFVDQIEFKDLHFVPALRMFLQAFRLPGEAQKIDRFMLKFAERFVLQNPTIFTNADTAYVLAYSVVMLNTDLYNPQVKNRMTKTEFVKNNRGINDGKDLSSEILEEIFNDIAREEIKMKEEIKEKDEKAKEPEFISMSDRQKKEAMFQVSEEYAKRSEAAFKNINRNANRHGVPAFPFYIARHSDHLRSMFDGSWMPIMAGVSNILQECDLNDAETTQMALYAFRSSVHMASVFELETARNAFISTMTKTAFLTSINDLIQKPKHVESIKALLEIAYLDGNGLDGSWMDLFRCMSGVERLLSSVGDLGNIEMGGVIPGVATGISGRESVDGDDKKRSQKTKVNGGKVEERHNLSIQEETQIQNLSQSLLVGLDRIFTSSARLNGTAIVQFVRWLCLVSLEEIQQSTSSSPLNTIPRMYSLTKLVEISYYNMSRIRLEWSNIWAVLGSHFNEVGCHANQHVALFAADSLRQLSMKFLEKQELSNFKFQKDFLKPFEYILSHHPSLSIKDMVMRCIHQIVHSKSQNIRSGWKTIFGVLLRGAKDKDEQIVLMAFDLVRYLQERYFTEVIIVQHTFPDYVSCLVEFAKNKIFPKVNLQSVELLKGSVNRIVLITKSSAETLNGDSVEKEPLTHTMTLNSAARNAISSKDDPILRLWFPIHFGLYEMIMNCDIEVRSRALKYLFEILKEHGSTYTTEFWDVLSRGVIFPIFDDLKLSKAEQRQFENKDEMTIWLNTTLIQALRQLVDLFSYSFTSLESMMLDGVLDLILVCFSVKQDNETLAKIGSSCLEQLVIQNSAKMSFDHWEKVVKTIEILFKNTRAELLTDPEFMEEVTSRADKIPSSGHSRTRSVESRALDETSINKSVSRSDINTLNRSMDNISKIDDEEPLQQVVDLDVSGSNASSSTLARKKSMRHLKKDFQMIIVKCVLQISVIQTVSDVLESEKFQVYHHISSTHLIRILKCCDDSYRFAKNFNANMQFRIALYKNGFMTQLPNLLKQETMSALCVLSNLFKVYRHGAVDEDPEMQSVDLGTQQDRREVFDIIQPWMMELSNTIIVNYNCLDPAVKKRNIQTWTPVIICILEGLQGLNDSCFKKHTSKLYQGILNIVARHDMTPNLRSAVYAVLSRVDQLWIISE